MMLNPLHEDLQVVLLDLQTDLLLLQLLDRSDLNLADDVLVSTCRERICSYITQHVKDVAILTGALNRHPEIDCSECAIA